MHSNTRENKITTLRLEADRAKPTHLQRCNDSVLVFLHSVMRELRRRQQTHAFKSQVSTQDNITTTGKGLNMRDW